MELKYFLLALCAVYFSHQRVALADDSLLGSLLDILGEPCPAGYVLEPFTGNCFQVVLEALNWADSGAKCAAMGGTLAVIDSAATDLFVSTILAALAPAVTTPCKFTTNLNPIQENGLIFHIAGQRRQLYNCSSDFCWKPTASDCLPLTYNAGWGPEEPDCFVVLDEKESCMHYWSSTGYMWNDGPCVATGCPVCQTHN